jgi:hypothetical protein
MQCSPHVGVEDVNIIGSEPRQWIVSLRGSRRPQYAVPRCTADGTGGLPILLGSTIRAN